MTGGWYTSGSAREGAGGGRSEEGYRKERGVEWEQEKQWTEGRIPALGVVWNEAPESAIHSVLVGGVSPMVLKDCARAAWSHPPGQVGCWLG